MTRENLLDLRAKRVVSLAFDLVELILVEVLIFALLSLLNFYVLLKARDELSILDEPFVLD